MQISGILQFNIQPESRIFNTEIERARRYLYLYYFEPKNVYEIFRFKTF